MVTENTKKIHLLSWKIRNEILDLFAHKRDIIRHTDCCYNKMCDGTYDVSGNYSFIYLTIIIIIN